MININEGEKVTVVMTAQEWAVVLNALDEIPRKASNGPYTTIVNAITEKANSLNGKQDEIENAVEKGEEQKQTKELKPVSN